MLDTGPGDVLVRGLRLLSARFPDGAAKERLKRLWRAAAQPRTSGKVRQGERFRASLLKDADALVTPNEVAERHGTGVVLRRIFGSGPGMLSIRSSSLYPPQSFAAAQVRVTHDGLLRSESFERMLHVLNGNRVRRVVCVPYFESDVVSAVVLKDLFQAPLCTFVMDDSNIFSSRIKDDLMREALEKSDLRLAISREMLDAYEKKYGLKFWLLPPVVAPGAICVWSPVATPALLESRTGVLIGNLWSPAWLNHTRRTVRESGLKVHWYGNASAPWLQSTREELERDGITDCGFLPEKELTARIAEYPFAVVPSGTLGDDDDRPELARLSLPTRLPYLFAASNMPVLVLGHTATAAAGFVTSQQAGLVTNYDGAAYRRAAEALCAPEQQILFRRNAAARSSVFSANGIADWIWRGLERGQPPDDRFGEIMPRAPGGIVPHVDAPAPKDIWRDFVPVYQALGRLKKRGFSPDFVVDVGSSTGVWSDTAERVFPDARFVLVEPLLDRYRKQSAYYLDKHPRFECLAVAVSDRPGTVRFQVSEDLYGSSLMLPADHGFCAIEEVPVTTLDEVFIEKGLTGRGLLKLDIQCAEHLALAGAKDLLAHVDALMLELSLTQLAPQAKVFEEMLDLVRELGYEIFDETGGWRDPVDGTLLQKDILFVRRSLFVTPDN